MAIYDQSVIIYTTLIEPVVIINLFFISHGDTYTKPSVKKKYFYAKILNGLKENRRFVKL